jgi:transcriptional regulator with XRE-family HTH domain
MEENNPRQIPIEHGDLSEIARILNVSHAHVSRWYHGKNVH